MTERQPIYTESQLLELKAHLTALQAFYEQDRMTVFVIDPSDIRYALEDIEGYIRHRLRGEPYDEVEL